MPSRCLAAFDYVIAMLNQGLETRRSSSFCHLMAFIFCWDFIVRIVDSTALSSKECCRMRLPNHRPKVHVHSSFLMSVRAQH
jgi:hypothetical protein